MRILGLAEAEVAPLIEAVSGPQSTQTELRDRFARAAWSGIAEPGDRTAGVLIEALGAETALETLVSRSEAKRILEQVGSEVELEEIQQGLERWLPRLKSSVVLLSLKQAARFSVKLLTPSDESWPISLTDLGFHKPNAIWLRGNTETLLAAKRSISLVGARAATGYGEHVTMEASAGLVDRGFAIISGAAYGIDGMAHRAALASGGQTVAVLAGGVDRFYPSGHETLLTRVVESGAVISELPCGSAPTKWRFLQRNRLIAALGEATVVLEAGWRSGSLNTAGHAASLGRPLGAVPGPVTSAASAGCHRLIRECDAVCVTSAAEMAQLVTGAFPAGPEAAFDSTVENPERIRLRDALSKRTPRQISQIAAISGLAIGMVQSLLGELQLEGQTVERESGWVLTSPRT